MKSKNEQGFTMVELIVVIAILGILGSMLVPAYNVMATKARISTDIATVKTLKRTADSYKAEMGVYPKATDLESLNTVLISSQYLESKAVLQTGADLYIVSEDKSHTYEIKLDLTKCDDATVDKALKQMNPEINAWLYGKSV